MNSAPTKKPIHLSEIEPGTEFKFKKLGQVYTFISIHYYVMATALIRYQDKAGKFWEKIGRDPEIIPV